MNVLITGANGFIGKNLVETLKNVRDGKDRTRNVVIDEIFCYDVESENRNLRSIVRRLISYLILPV